MSKTSRRTILAGAATLPVLAVPAVAGILTPDPIFAGMQPAKVVGCTSPISHRAFVQPRFKPLVVFVSLVVLDCGPPICLVGKAVRLNCFGHSWLGGSCCCCCCCF